MKIGDEMKFLMLVCAEEDPDAPEPTDTETDEETDDGDGSFPWLDDVVARGIRLDGDRLASTRTARTVAVREGEMLVSDGPFAETKEVICGYDVLECATLEEAVQVAAAHPVAAFGKIEVRPFWK
jgi:hypothetical protein